MHNTSGSKHKNRYSSLLEYAISKAYCIVDNTSRSEIEAGLWVTIPRLIYRFKIKMSKFHSSS